MIRPLRVAMALLLALAAGSAAGAEKPIAFYAPWDAASLASLQANAAAIGTVVPAWASVTGADHRVTIVPDEAGRAALRGTGDGPKLWLMVQNALGGAWDGAGMAALLRDPDAVARWLDAIEAEATADRANGLVLDLEALPASAQPDLLRVLDVVRRRCATHRWTLAVTAPVADPSWDLGAIAARVDRVVLMAYDEHWQTGTPGPIASQPWFASVLAAALKAVPPRKAIVALASYAYDWPAGGAATVLSIPQATALAARHGVSPERDAASGAAHFTYAEGGVHHDVWMADAPAVRAQIDRVKAMRGAGVALWRLGTEDPQIWSLPGFGRD